MKLKPYFYICLAYAYILFSNIIIFGHGFGANTLIELADGSKKTIYSICLQSLKNEISVISYDINNYATVTQKVTVGKKSKTNCYICLGFGNQSDDSIICTPTQEFYLPAEQTWIAAYKLKPGDALLTKNITAVAITHIELVCKPLKIYMLEIEDSHTFFVGKYSVLTHNMLLPMAASVGFVIPFGSVTTGGIGSFFGPIGLIGGIAFGGLVGFAAKILYEKRIPSYKTPSFDISLMHSNCHTIISPNNSSTKPSGCFESQALSHNTHIYPSDIPTPPKIGCIQIETYVPNKPIANNSSKNEQLKINKQGCFQPAEQKQQSGSNENPTIEKPNQRPTARNWKEFEQNCSIGQKYGKKFLHTGRQNPKDGSPIRKLSEDIPDTEMFKKNRLFAPDRFHEGDHLEVWDMKGKWLGVANLDGSKNEKKTNAEINPNNRNLPR